MNEEEIKEMHSDAERALEDIKKISEISKKILINCFKKKWWGLTPEEAIKIGK